RFALSARRLSFTGLCRRAGIRPHAREEQAHAGAAADFTGEARMAADLLHEAIYHAQAQAGPGADVLRGEERFDRACTDLRRHACSRVRDGDAQVVATRGLFGLARVFVERYSFRLDRQRAARGHRIARVEGQVEDGRLELVQIR